MKKAFVIGITILLTLAVTACGGNATPTEPPSPTPAQLSSELEQSATSSQDDSTEQKTLTWEEWEMEYDRIWEEWETEDDRIWEESLSNIITDQVRESELATINELRDSEIERINETRDSEIERINETRDSALARINEMRPDGSAVTSTPDNSQPIQITPGDIVDSPRASDSEWKEFLRLYEEWVDDYIELLQRYSENPTDVSILSDYLESMQKLIEWSEQADKIQSDLSGDDLREYLATISRIIEKLNALN